MLLAKATAPSSPPPSSVRPPPPPLSAPLRWLHSHRGALLSGAVVSPADEAYSPPSLVVEGLDVQTVEQPGDPTLAVGRGLVSPLIPLPAVPGSILPRLELTGSGCGQVVVEEAVSVRVAEEPS